MLEHQTLRPGTRVHLRAQPIGLLLASFSGTVVRPDTLWDGYYIIRLDEPAYERPAQPDQPAVKLDEIREAADNLDIVETD